MSINPPLRLLAAFQQNRPGTPHWVLEVPGREMWVAAEVGQSGEYTILAPDLDGRTTFNRRSARSMRTVLSRPLPRWSRYIAGVTLALNDDGLQVPGAYAVIVGEEPPGPRYEHALGMACAALWYAYNQEECALPELLDLMERVQHHYM